MLSDVNITPDETQNDEDDDESKEKITHNSFLQSELQMLEEIAHELSSLVYERQFEQAIDILESTVEKTAELKREVVDPAALASLNKIKAEIDSTSNKLVEILMNELKVCYQLAFFPQTDSVECTNEVHRTKKDNRFYGTSWEGKQSLGDVYGE